MFENYSENEYVANNLREEYADGMHNFVDKLTKAAAAKRFEFGLKIKDNREEWRKKYIELLGFPLTEEKFPILSVEETPIFENENTVAVRLRFEMFEGLKFYGILLRHKSDKPLPLVVCQHGGAGTPEITIPFGETSYNYNDLSERIYHKGVNVFAPQLNLWETNEQYAKNGGRDKIDRKLKLIGSSIAALEIYFIKRALDYFEEQDYCNKRFGMAGLSYGGFYTLHTAAADTRIISALATCCFFDIAEYTTEMSSMILKGAGNFFSFAEVGALVAPRYLNIKIGKNDGVFNYKFGEAEFERLKAYYSDVPDMVDFGLINGEHEFCLKGDDTAIDKFIFHLNND